MTRTAENGETLTRYDKPGPRKSGHALSAIVLTAAVLLFQPMTPALAAQAKSTLSAEAGAATDRADASGSTYKGVRQAAAEDYVIGPGDVLAVNVWKDAELSRAMPVRPDGHISLPLIGEMQAAGLTATELQQAIQQKLQSYMTHPEVNVIVQEIKSRSFNVVGKVNKAGVYDLLKPITVLDALAQAGGFQDFARVTKIYVLRRTDGNSTRMLPFNYKQVVKGKSLDQNVELQPGDTIVVP